MKPVVHKVYIGSMALIITAAFVYLVYIGIEFYNTPMEERFYHPDYANLKPSGYLDMDWGLLDLC